MAKSTVDAKVLRRAREELRRRKQRRQRLTTIGLTVGGAVVVALIGWFAFLGNTGPQGDGSVDAFDLPRLNGEGRVRLVDFEGSPTVVNLFASWCTACDAELPGFARVSAELRDEVDFVGVASLDTGDKLLMPRRHGVDWWPVATDVGRSESAYHDGLGLRRGSMPGTAFYDAEGNLVDVARGALTEQQLRQRLRANFGLDV